MRGLYVALATAVAMCVSTAALASASGCPDPNAPNCGVQAGVTSDQAQGQFHGLIAVRGRPDVLATAAHSGTSAGCGDCVWTLIMMCLVNTPTDPHNQQTCVGAGNAPQCRPGQTAYRLYLTTHAAANQLIETLCLGGPQDVIPVGDIAAADVARYLDTIRPPPLVMQTQPPQHAIAGLATYFMVRPPNDLQPTTLASNGEGIVETITIEPLHYTWSWGDSSDDFATDDAGAPYPTGQVTHIYASGGRAHGSVTAQWGAHYTITMAGATYGPYDATGGVVPRTQAFDLPIATAHSRLVSH